MIHYTDTEGRPWAICDCSDPNHIHFPWRTDMRPEDHAFVRQRWWQRLLGYRMCRECDCPASWHRKEVCPNCGWSGIHWCAETERVDRRAKA